MADYGITQGTRVPSIQATLLAPGAKVAQDLTGNTGIVFRWQKADLTGPVREGVASTVGAESAGVVKYDWVAGDTDTAGQYVGHFVVTFADGRTGSWPRPKITIEIEPKLVAA